MAKKDKYIINKEKLIKLVNQKLSSTQIAEHFQCTDRVILNRMRRWDIQTQYSRLRSDLIGRRFNRILIIGHNDKLSISKRHYWICKCDCGKIFNTTTSSFSGAMIKSCGCRNREITRNQTGQLSKHWTGYKYITGTRWNSIKSNAKVKKIPLEIDIIFANNLLEYQNFQCALSGSKICIGREHNRGPVTTASLDRIDSQLGYLKNNVQWIHQNINFMKHKMNIGKFLSLCYLVVYPLKQISPFVYTVTQRQCSWTGYGNIGGAEFGRIQRSALKRNLIFDINIQNLWNLFVKQKGRCNITGCPLYFTYHKKYTYLGNASLDRIDNSKGYTIDNVQWIRKEINMMKYTFTMDEFKSWCQKIVNHTYGDLVGENHPLFLKNAGTSGI